MAIWGDDLHLLIVELGYVGELLLQILGEALPLEVVERVGAHDAEIDALQEKDVGGALHRTSTDDREDAQFTIVVEHGSEVGAELHVGATDRAGKQRDRVGVERVPGRD